jgi:transposase
MTPRAKQVQSRLPVAARRPVREQLRHLPTFKLIATCARLRPGHLLGDTDHATKTALRRLARRHQQLSEEITEADQELHQLVHQAAPALLALPGVGPEVAGQMLISAGDNLDRIKSEAAFGHLCGAAPIPASMSTSTGSRGIAEPSIAQSGASLRDLMSHGTRLTRRCLIYSTAAEWPTRRSRQPSTPG